MNIEDFLGTVSSQLNAVKQARNLYAAKLSPDFNCFQYILPDEHRLSQILADLLDPKGKHSQGHKFLFSFLRMAGLERLRDENLPKIETEATTTHIERSNRRIDIKITWDKRAIAIENKPWAGDQQYQIRDYIKEISNYDDWHLIYISGTGHDPLPYSISEQDLIEYKTKGKVTVISYTNLVSWLNDCMADCQSERFRWFLGEFKLYLLAEFKGEKDMQERKLIVEEALKNSDRLKAALEVSKAMIDIKERLLEKLKVQLEEGIKKLGLNWKLVDWDVQLLDKDGGFTFDFNLPEKQQYFLRFEFERSQLKDFFFGVKRADPNLPHNQDITDIMKKASHGLGQGQTSSPLWLWWAYFPRDLRDWMDSNEPWVMIQDNILGDEIIKKVKACYDAFIKDDRLSLLNGNNIA